MDIGVARYLIKRNQEKKYKKENGYHCVICGDRVDNYTPSYCCLGIECGCYGLPHEPPVCLKQECQDAVFGADTERSEVL